MTKHDLKELAAMGAELGAAKAEAVRLRGGGCVEGSVAEDLRAILAQPADAEGVEVVGWRIGFPNGSGYKLYEQRQDWAYEGYGSISYEVQDLMTVAQHERIVAALTRPAQTAPQPERDREADRARFPDPTFNKWLDEVISDAGHTVWDQVNVCDAWAGWENRQWYTAPQHTDDEAVDRFAVAMKAKLAASRAKGRGGWDDASVCTVEFLAQLLVEHLGKGNAGTFEDVANFSMMLHQRGADPKVLAEAARPRGEVLDACLEKRP